MNALVSVLEIAVYVLTVVAVVGILAAYALVTWGFFRFRRWAHALVDKLVAASATSGVPLRQPARRKPSAEARRLREHDTDSVDCWCRPDARCLDCYLLEPCIHGTDRDTLVVHRQAS